MAFVSPESPADERMFVHPHNITRRIEIFMELEGGVKDQSGIVMEADITKRNAFRRVMLIVGMCHSSVGLSEGVTQFARRIG